MRAEELVADRAPPSPRLRGVDGGAHVGIQVEDTPFPVQQLELVRHAHARGCAVTGVSALAAPVSSSLVVAREVVRSGTSGSSHASRNERSAMTAAVRKTGRSEAATAVAYASWSVGGRWLTTFGLTVVGGCTPAGSSRARLPCSLFAKIAPKIATPNEPPICRKRIAPDVATPMKRYSTAFCTASTSTCITIPSPSPTTSM